MSEQLEDKKMNTYASGMIREDKSKKVMFDLIFPEKQKLENTLIYRFANHLTKGASVHGDRNWEKASGVKELEDFKRGAWRHVIQFLTGQTDEDHAAATFFNINGMVYLMDKLSCDVNGHPVEKKSEIKNQKIEKVQRVYKLESGVVYEIANIGIVVDNKNMTESFKHCIKDFEALTTKVYNNRFDIVWAIETKSSGTRHEAYELWSKNTFLGIYHIENNIATIDPSVEVLNAIGD